MTHLTKLFIDGAYRESSTKETFEVRNPYTQEVVALCSSASRQDCIDAIEAAGKAFSSWEHTTVNQRRDIVLKAAELVATDRYKELVINSMQEETASVPSWGFANWVGTSNFLKTTAALANELKGDYFSSGTVPGVQVITQRRAIGVILAVAPWNAPFALSLRAIAVPILCGNTVVLKSSELSPRGQSLAIDLLQEAGLPAGVLNFISMSRESAPALTAEIIAHPLVKKINFTGSDRVGKILAMEAAKYLKPCVLELGGKAPVIVLDDANIQEAAKAIVFGAMTHSGQVCMSTERVIVQKGVSEALISAVSNLCNELRAGDHKVTQLSALFTEGHARGVIDMIKEAVDSGAKLIHGDLGQQGAVVQPHLLVDVKPGMRIWERESFGPVLGFMIVDTIDEAIEMANATEYSLTAAIWTTNVHTAMSVAPRIRAGSASINGPSFHSEPYLGILGLGGASGYGRFDIENFTDKRLLVLYPGTERQYPLFS